MQENPELYSILNSEEKVFASNLLAEMRQLNLNKRLGELVCLAAIKDLNAEKRELIKSKFGDEALKSAELFGRISNIALPEGEKKIATLRKVFIELSDDLKIIILKLYERLTTLKIAFASNSENLKSLADECLNLYAPIAQRLGIRQVYNPMEDIAFKVLYPEDFAKLDKAIEKRRSIFEKKLHEMTAILHEQMEKNGIKCDIQARVKRPYSIFKKLVNQNTNLDNIFDLMALRIITDKVDNCYLALGIVHRNWIPIEKRFRDWVTFPKPNGYRSIQTTITTKTGDKFEIQIRTAEMHNEAEYGTAAHWAYKEKSNAESDSISKLKEFLENDEYFNNPDALDELLKADAKRNYIHILTPKGEVRTIPEGSTILDFANTIHTDVFLTCVGGRINGKFAKLKTELQTGDIVEITTNKNSKPSRDWLKILKSPSAKTKLIQWLKKNESNQILADGKRNWEHFKKANRHKLNGFDDETAFKQNLTKIGYKSPEDFYSSIGTNSLKLSLTLLRKLYPEAFVKKEDPAKKAQKSGNAEDPEVIVEGLENIETHLAKCCNPIKGEPIVAYVSKTGIKIHAATCRHINKDADEERLKPAQWADSNSLQTSRLQIFGIELTKMLLASAEIAQALKINITSTRQVPSGSELNCLEAMVQIKDIEQLDIFRKKLRATAGIEAVK